MKKETITIVDAPQIILHEDEKAGDVLLKFYRALGWNGEDSLDPCKVKVSKSVYDNLYGLMINKCPDAVGVGMLIVNQGPSVDDGIPIGEVYLLDGWTTLPEQIEVVS